MSEASVCGLSQAQSPYFTSNQHPERHLIQISLQTKSTSSTCVNSKTCRTNQPHLIYFYKTKPGEFPNLVDLVKESCHEAGRWCAVPVSLFPRLSSQWTVLSCFGCCPWPDICQARHLSTEVTAGPRTPAHYSHWFTYGGFNLPLLTAQSSHHILSLSD